jgi:hypothetical protein
MTGPVSTTLLSRYALDAVGALAASQRVDLTTPRGRAICALAARLEGMSWVDCATVASLPTADAARKAAARALSEYGADVGTIRDLLLLKCEVLFNTAMTDYGKTGNPALLRVAEKVLQRQQSLTPALATTRTEVVVRAAEATVYGARPEYGGDGRTWYHQVRDGLDETLHPDDVERYGLTPAKCAELRAIWAREADLERARLVEL